MKELKWKELNAGSLRMYFENGGLRYIKWGEHEILRRIYVAVRDRNWETIPAEFSILQCEEFEDSFQLIFEAVHREREIDFVWRGEITGDAAGTIHFNFDGEARSTFLRNRIGFCLLHPAELAGANCHVRYANGSEFATSFPKLVAQEQPIKAIHDLGSISHEVVPGLWADVTMSGDLFEMEDQRNWIDASYKTYCTPLRIPFPLEVVTGTRLTQSVELRLREVAPIVAVAKNTSINSDVFLSLTEQRFAVPRIGFGLSSYDLSSREIERLSKLKPAHLRVDLKFSDDTIEQQFIRACHEAERLNSSLEIALFLSDNAEAELNVFISFLKEHQPKIARWIIFDAQKQASTVHTLQLSRQFLQSFGAPIGGGTNADFYQLNQAPAPAMMMDFVTFSMNPQTHAFDTPSLVEALTAIPHPIQSARKYFNELPVSISPITMKPRFNAVATASETESLINQLPSSVDVRQLSLFGAAWTLGAVKRLTESEPASFTCFETTGWCGVMETEKGSPLPEQFPSQPGGVFPLYHVLADVAEFIGGEALAIKSSDAFRVEAMSFERGERRTLLLANLTEATQIARMEGISTAQQIRRLRIQNLETALLDPEIFRSQSSSEKLISDKIELSPYEFVRLNW